MTVTTGTNHKTFEGFLVWCIVSGSGFRNAEHVAAVIDTEPPSLSGHWAHAPGFVELLGRQEDRSWRSVWGGGSDPLH